MPKDFTFYLTRKSTFEKIMVVFKNGVLKLWSQTKYFIVLLFTLRMLSVFKLRCVLIWTGRAAWLCCPYGYRVYPWASAHPMNLFSFYSDQQTLHKERHLTWVCNCSSLFSNKGPSVPQRWQLQKVQSWHLTFTYGGEWQQALHQLALWHSCLLHLISSSPDTWVCLEKWKGHCLFRSYPLD